MSTIETAGFIVGLIAGNVLGIIAHEALSRRRMRKYIKEVRLTALTRAWYVADMGGNVPERDRIEATLRDEYGIISVTRVDGHGEE